MNTLLLISAVLCFTLCLGALAWIIRLRRQLRAARAESVRLKRATPIIIGLRHMPIAECPRCNCAQVCEEVRGVRLKGGWYEKRMFACGAWFHLAQGRALDDRGYACKTTPTAPEAPAVKTPPPR